MASRLPTKYNLEPRVVSTYNVIIYATQRINDERMRALFSMNQGSQDDVCIAYKHRML